MSDNHGGISGLPVLDTARLHTLGDETGLGVHGIATLYLDQMGQQLGELRAAIQEGSAAAVARSAHKCAGSTLLAGMERLSRLLMDLEHSAELRLGDPGRCLTTLEREFDAVTLELSALVAPGDAASRSNDG